MTPIAAIFDLDDTLLRGSSGRLFLRYVRRERLYGNFFHLRTLLPIFASYLLYRLGKVDALYLMKQAAQVTRGVPTDELWPVVYRWFDEIVAPLIAPAARAQLAWHVAQGHIPVICSASSQFSVQPVATHLGIEHAIYTEWLVEEGRLTGQLREPIAYGEGKVYWMEHWATVHGVSLADSYFYTDHISDRPLLERVASPMVVNPNPHLARLALARNWPVLNWR